MSINYLNKKVKASALIYVLFLMIFFSIIFVSILFLLYDNSKSIEKLIRTNKLNDSYNSSLELILNDFETINKNKRFTYVLDKIQKDTIDILIKKWGILDIINLQISNEKDSKSISFFLGDEYNNDSTALYLSNKDISLSIAGNSKIIGNVFLPNANYKSVYFEGNPVLGEKPIKGKIFNSEIDIPFKESFFETMIYDSIINKTIFDSKVILNKEFKSNNLYNSFFKKTIVYYFTKSAFIKKMNISGNIVIISGDSLIIDNSTVLDNTLLIAPIVKVNNNFKGSLQIIAYKGISIGNNCFFEYPSVLCLASKANHNVNSIIKIGKNNNFSGTIINTNSNALLEIEKDNKICADIYFAGQIDLKSNIYGTVYCDYLVIKTIISFYKNYLYNVSIINNKNNLGTINPLIKDENKKSILKWLE